MSKLSALARRLSKAGVEAYERIQVEVAGRRAKPQLPARLWVRAGGRDRYYEQGRDFFSYLIENSEMAPSGAVLDIGCGYGRYAVLFQSYLSASGRYVGLDVEPVRLRWCQLTIGKGDPRFRFARLRASNSLYHPGQRADGRSVVLPYGDATFDLTFLASVFTHLLDAELRQYLREISRTLKPGGACVATFYLMTDARRQQTRQGTHAFAFAHRYADCWVESLQVPAAAVAHDEEAVIACAREFGLSVSSPVRYGAWTESRSQDQDFVVLTKDGAPAETVTPDETQAAAVRASS